MCYITKPSALLDGISVPIQVGLLALFKKNSKSWNFTLTLNFYCGNYSRVETICGNRVIITDLLKPFLLFPQETSSDPSEHSG